MPVQIGTLPGFANHRRRRRKNRCKYQKGTKAKARWRHARRKWKRNRKRRIRKSRNSRSRTSSKSSMSVEKKAKMEKRNKIRKWKRLRKKKDLRRKHQLKRHLHGTSARKLRVKSMKKMTKEQIIARLAVLKTRRKQIIKKHYCTEVLVCSPKRKVIRRLKKCWRRARHQRKKYERYRRHLEALARQRNLEKWRYCDYKKTKKPRQAVKFVEPPKLPKVVSKRVEYVKKYPKKVPVHLLETKSVEVHCAPKKKNESVPIAMGNMIVRVSEPVVGDFGRAKCKVHYVGHEDWAPAQLRWETALVHHPTASKEGQIIAKLAKLGTPNVVRILFAGEFMNLDCLVTTNLRTCDLGDLLIQKHDWDMASSVHLIQQTFYCVRDLHKIGYSHLAISPSNFAFPHTYLGTVVYSNFEFARTRESLRERPPIQLPDDRPQKRIRVRLPKLHKMPYMSRRQHIRMVKGSADDYESWFYVCARILNNEMVMHWENDKTLKEMSHIKMAMAKYEFVKKFKHPDKLTDKKMKQILGYCLTANDTNHKNVAYFIERVIQHWVAKLEPEKKEDPKKPLKVKVWPWMNPKKPDVKKVIELEEKFLKDNKEWYKPKKRTCRYS